MARKGKKVTKTKNCVQTSCGLTCIPTNKTCRITDPKSKSKISTKTSKLKQVVDKEVEKDFSGSPTSSKTGKRNGIETRALGKAILDEYGRAGDKAKKAVDKEVEKAFSGSKTGKRNGSVTRAAGKAILDEYLSTGSPTSSKTSKRNGFVTRAAGKAMLDEYGRSDKAKKAVDKEVEKAFSGSKTSKRNGFVTRAAGKAILDEYLSTGSKTGKRTSFATRAFGKAILDEYGRAGDKARKAVDKEVEKGSGAGVKGGRKSKAVGLSKTLRREAAQRIIAELTGSTTKPKKETKPAKTVKEKATEPAKTVKEKATKLAKLRATDTVKEKETKPAKTVKEKETKPTKLRATDMVKEKATEPTKLRATDTVKLSSSQIATGRITSSDLNPNLKDSDKVEARARIEGGLRSEPLIVIKKGDKDFKALKGETPNLMAVQKLQALTTDAVIISPENVPSAFKLRELSRKNSSPSSEKTLSRERFVNPKYVKSTVPSSSFNQKDIESAAQAIIKLGSNSIAPAVVERTGLSAYKVTGNHFNFYAAQRAMELSPENHEKMSVAVENENN
jgi:hypothetical protein